MSAVQEVEIFCATPPNLIVNVQGFRNQSEYDGTVVFDLNINFQSHLVAETVSGSVHYQSLIEAATEYDLATKSKYKVFHLEKRACLPYNFIKQLVTTRIKSFIPHFLERDDCSLIFWLQNSTTHLNLNSGSRKTCGKIHDSCCDPCMKDRECMVLSAIFGLAGCCALSSLCVKKQTFTPLNNNTIYFAVPEDEAYLKQIIEDSIVANQFENIHV